MVWVLDTIADPGPKGLGIATVGPHATECIESTEFETIIYDGICRLFPCPVYKETTLFHIELVDL